MKTKLKSWVKPIALFIACDIISVILYHILVATGLWNIYGGIGAFAVFVTAFLLQTREK